jgi:hypothetical protein
MKSSEFANALLNLSRDYQLRFNLEIFENLLET